MSKKTFISSSIIAALIAFTTPNTAVANDDGTSEFKASGFVMLTSEITSKSRKWTNGKPGAMGSFRLDHSSGLYASVTGYNTASYINPNGSEFDFAFGYQGTFNDNMSFDAGYVRYTLPGLGKITRTFRGNTESVELGWDEVYFAITTSNLLTDSDSLRGGVNYAWDYILDTDHASYWTLDYSVPFADSGWKGLMHVGYSALNSNEQFIIYTPGVPGTDKDSFTDFKVGAGYTFGSFYAEIAYIGTNLSESDCPKTMCENRFLVSLIRSF